MTTETADHSPLLRGIAGRLESQYGDHFTRETLDHYVDDSFLRLASEARIMVHVPALVERFARQRIRALAKLGGHIEGHRPDVLFVCDRDDASAQIAAALFAAEAGDRATAHAAGAMPDPDLLADAIAVMAALGIELDDRPPVPVTPEIEAAADVVVTLDAHDDVPIVDDTRYVAWRTAPNHPYGLDGYRRWCDDLADHVRELVAEIVPPNPRPGFGRSLDELEAIVAASAAGVLAGLDALGVGTPGTDGPRPVGAPARAAHHDVETAVVELIACQQPVAGDLRRIFGLHVTSLHLARMGDGLDRVGRLLGDGGAIGDPAVLDQLRRMARTVARMTRGAVGALTSADGDLALAAASGGREIDAQHEAALDAAAHAIAVGASGGPLVLAVGAAIELHHLGDHAVAIAEQAWFRATGEHTLPAGPAHRAQPAAS